MRRESSFQGKGKAVTIHVMYHSIQQLDACEESPLKVRERCVSRIAEKRFGLRATSSQKVIRRISVILRV